MPVTLNSVVQVLIFLALVLLITKPVGLYLTAVFSGRRTWLSPVLIPVERVIYRLSGVDPEEEQKWTGYVIAMLLFSVAGMLLLYLLERTQQWHPAFLNPQGLGPVEQRVVQNFNPYTVVHALDGTTQVIAQGPVASQEIIKEMGTNGGGFFNAN